jgi:transposase
MHRAWVARDERWPATVEILTRFKGVWTRAALGLIAEIGDFHRFSHPREPCAWLGIFPSELLLRPSSATAGTSPRPATTTPAGC